jgi:hypothetical protein
MPNSILDRCEPKNQSPGELDRLARFIESHFPEEVASEELRQHEATVDKAIELLERLWRWER